MSEKQKHTPGPWEVASPAMTSDRCVRDVAHREWICGPIDGNTVTESAANARLIAAAPDLLAALRRVMEIIDAGDDLSNEAFYGVEHAQFRAAIARAEGGES